MEMEDSSQGLRRSRAQYPESTTSSSHTRMTPQSSTNSSITLPTRPTTRGTMAGSLLQERLRERKVESARRERRLSVDLGQRGVQSSPIKGSGSGSGSGREERRPSSSGTGKGVGMGVKQIEEHVSTLTKQNFNLKLELHHRRERQTALEKRLEAAELQIEEQKELQEVNEQLLAELEKRDQAVEEAVGIIVGLEDKVESLMQEREVVRSFDNKYESTYFRPSHDEPSSSPPTSNEKRPNKHVARMPSFLSVDSEGADALRSLYLPNHQSHRDGDATLPKLQEEPMDGMNSPRLSALSESSFTSIYGNNKLSLDDPPEEEPELPQRRLRKSSSVEKWIDERHVSTTPVTARKDVRKNQYLSITDVMESPLQRLEKLKLVLEKNDNNVSKARLQMERSTSVKEAQKPRDALRRVLTDKDSFDHQRGLPPTPDTISTSTLRHFQANSNDTLAEDARGKTFLNSTSTFSAPDPTYNPHQSALSMRPRSAGETVTSRREGHGWDTETQADEFSSTASTFSAQHFTQPKRIMTPNLFSFNDFNQDDEHWGSDVMFHHDSSIGLPSHTASRYAALRSNSLADHPRSEDTVTTRVPAPRCDTFGTSPIDTSPRPAPPDRRSSLSATTKLRKTRDVANNPVSPQITNSPTAKPEPRKNKLTSRFFGRSDTSPALPTLQRSKTGGNGKGGYFEGGGYEDDDVARATPPPIKRSRDSGLPRYRPSSAGTGIPENGNNMRRGFGFGGDGAEDSVQMQDGGRERRGSVGVGLSGDAGDGAGEPSSATKTGGGRKWLGFGRTGSLRQK